MNDYKLIANSILSPKGTKNVLLHKGYQRIDILHGELPVGGASYITNFKEYIEELITEYDKYLGYPSGLTFNMVNNAYHANLILFCMTLVLKRAYDTKNVELAGGARTSSICQRLITVNSGEASSCTSLNRFSNDILGLSNAVWVSDVIAPFSEILLPNAIMGTYAYYLQNVFDISSRDTNEALSLMVLWPGDSMFSIENIHGSNFTISKTAFAALVANMRSYNTARLRDFLTRFVRWTSPASWDMTRDIYGNTINIVRDEKLIYTFNNIFPENVKKLTGDLVDEDGLPLPNGWARYYNDFEMILDCDGSTHDVEASKYFQAVSGVAFEGYLSQYEDYNNTMLLDFTKLPLMALLCSIEVGLGSSCAGGIYSVFTSIDATFGTLIESRLSVKQICWGNDIQLLLGTEESVSNFPIPPSAFYSAIGDYGEAGDVKDQLAILNFPVAVKERWAYGVFWYSDRAAEMFVGAYVEYDLPTALSFNSASEEWTLARPHTTYINHDSDYTAFTTFVFDANEVNVAINATVFLMITGFITYSSAVNYITSGFAGKQQSTDK